MTNESVIPAQAGIYTNSKWILAFAGMTFVLLWANVVFAVAPNQTSNVAPTAGGKETTVTPTLTGFVYSDDDNVPIGTDLHTDSEWEVREASGTYTTPVYTGSEVGGTISHITGALQYATQYYWHVRYKDTLDDLWSSYSNETNFTTPLQAPTAVTGTVNTSSFSITWTWTDGVNPLGTTYRIYLVDGGQILVGTSASKSFVLEVESDLVTPLESGKTYEVQVIATDPTSSFADSNFSASGTRELVVDCTNGVECRKGEICLDHDGDGGTTPMRCLPLTACDGSAPTLGASCYVSACPPGIDDVTGNVNCHTSPSKRIFTATPGKCTSVLPFKCDLQATEPHTPLLCDNAGANCQIWVTALTAVPLQPELQWTNGDPDETFNDYTGSSVTFIGDRVWYTLTVAPGPPGPTFDGDTYPSLDYVPSATVAKQFNYNADVSDYLDFNTNYIWTMSARDESTLTLVPTSTPWDFTTKDVCDVLQYDLQPLDIPTSVTLSWDPPANLITDSILTGPGAGGVPEYDLRMQEYVGGAWQAFSVFPSCGGTWGCAQENDEAISYTFGGVNPSLTNDNDYQYQIVLHHSGGDVDCPIQSFTVGGKPEMVLVKRINAIQGPTVTYQIDFSFTGPPGSAIRDFYVTETFDPLLLLNTDTSDDLVITTDPVTLKLASVDIENNGTGATDSFQWNFVSGDKAPIAHWKLDETAVGAGTTIVDSIGTNDGTTVNNVDCSAAGQFNTGCVFAGTAAPNDEHILLGSSFSLPPAGSSLTFWFNYNVTGDVLFGKDGNNGMWIYNQASNIVEFQPGGSAVEFIVPAMSSGTWYHVAITRNNNITRVYFNGVEATMANPLAYPPTQTGAGTFDAFGRYSNGSFGFGFNGTLDDIKVYDYGLDPVQVTRVYTNTETPEGEIGVGTTGSLAFVANTVSGQPACTFINNQATGGGTTVSGSPFTALPSNLVSHLAETDDADPGHIQTRHGDIHSNASVCFSNAPKSGFYIGDYFVSANDTVITNLNFTPLQLSRLSQSATDFTYIRDFPHGTNISIDEKPSDPAFADIDYNDITALVSPSDEVTGECSVVALFGSATVSLGEKVYRCKTGISGIDVNNDEIVDNGDMVINERLTIVNNGQSGTVVVDGNLYIEDDIVYSDESADTITDVDQLASLGWIVRGDIFVREFLIDEVDDCDPGEPGVKWCDSVSNTLSGFTYDVLEEIDPDGIPSNGDEFFVLRYGPVRVGPVHMVGTFFAEGKIDSGRINLPLTVEGSLIAGEVNLDRLPFPE